MLSHVALCRLRCDINAGLDVHLVTPRMRGRAGSSAARRDRRRSQFSPTNQRQSEGEFDRNQKIEASPYSNQTGVSRGVRNSSFDTVESLQHATCRPTLIL